MSATLPFRHELPHKIAEMLAEEEEPMQRKFCEWLAHWRHCTAPACRRAHACAGDPTACFMRRWSNCPEPASVWVHAGMFAVREGLAAREAVLLADDALLRHVKTNANLPQRRPRRHRRRPA
jgi:hypothetical protein